MTGIDPLRLGRAPPPPSDAPAPRSAEPIAARVAPPAGLAPPSAAGADAAAPGAARAEPPSLAALILAAAAPRDFDRRLLQPDRLQAVLDETLAALDQADPGDEIAQLAAAVIAEELARHLALARVCAGEAPAPAAAMASP